MKRRNLAGAVLAAAAAWAIWAPAPAAAHSLRLSRTTVAAIGAVTHGNSAFLRMGFYRD